MVELTALISNISYYIHFDYLGLQGENGNFKKNIKIQKNYKNAITLQIRAVVSLKLLQV